MGIKDLLRREDFYKILRETIIQYARVVLHKEVKCDYSPFFGAEAWSINAALGFVSRTPIPKGVRTYLKSEYNVRGGWLKYLIGRAAVYVITLFPFIGTSKKLFVGQGIFDKNVFIVPQNRSIRFYNYETMTVDCIVKSGFTSKYYNNQAVFRTEFSRYGFLNPMLSKGEGWFREPILIGHPLIRTTDHLLFEKGTDCALGFMKSLAKETMEWTPAQAYVQSLKADVEGKISHAITEKGIKGNGNVEQLLELSGLLTQRINSDIPTCISHGDFQAGNIWIDPTGKTLIYDWETAGRRSVWYDSATLCYSLRRAYGWKSMLEDKTGNGLYQCVPDGVDIQIDRKSILGILLLEDILFYLDDMLELPKDWGRDSFDAFLSNIMNLEWDI